MIDMGIGATVIGATVIAGDTVYVDPNIPNYDHAFTIPVPAQTAEGSLPVAGAVDQLIDLASVEQTGTIAVVGEQALTVATPTNTATIAVEVSSEAGQNIAVPDQSFEMTTAFYFAATQTIDVPSQTAEGDVPNNGRSELADGYRVQAKPIIGAFAIGDEIATGDAQLASAMAFVTQTAEADNPVDATAAATIAAPTLDANLRPIVAAAHEATLLVDSSSGSGDVDVAALAAVNVIVESQTATGTITIAGAAGLQQVPGATNAATIAAHASAAASQTIGAPTNTETTVGPVVEATGSAWVDLAIVVNLAFQEAEGDVDVSVNTEQTDAVLPHVTNATATDTLVLGESDQTIPAPAWDVLGGPVVQAEHATSIDVPAQDATGEVFFNVQAAQQIAVPAQTATGTVEIAAESSIEITFTETTEGDVDFTVTAAQVIDLESAAARARIYRPATRSRARRYGGTAYPSPTESGYLSWLRQWAS